MARIVYFPLFSSSVDSKVFSLDEPNPGVGGTQFTTIRLAILLSIACPTWNIHLVNNLPFKIKDKPNNLNQLHFNTPDDFFNHLDEYFPGVVVSTPSVLCKTNFNILRKIEEKIICWSRHPFDPGADKVARNLKVKGIVCVGIYQFFSNKFIHSDLFSIQNVFIYPEVAIDDDKDISRKEKIDVVYLGALRPSKGFLDVAKSWCALKSKFPGIKLHVIGSAETHALQSVSSPVPASSTEYANQILEFIDAEDIVHGNVIFYGNLGREKFDIIKNCDFAILNPTGIGEAFPASPLEVMSCGVPVITSNDYGMSDCMRFFPELVINSYQEIVYKAIWLVEDPLRYREVQRRAVAVAKWFDLQTDGIVVNWIRLINSTIENTGISLPPIMPFNGSRAKLYRRLYFGPVMNKIQRIPAKLFGKQAKIKNISS
ncbi:MAG: glycosyltransferase [Cyanobacteria bacterium P01_D01_bin.156]